MNQDTPFSESIEVKIMEIKNTFTTTFSPLEILRDWSNISQGDEDNSFKRFCRKQIYDYDKNNNSNNNDTNDNNGIINNTNDMQ